VPTIEGLEKRDEQFAHFQSDAPACDNCGALTVRCGTCYRCFNCGNSMGCS
jgi:ribonucleoside-diphosphate reductase alpha chain